MSSMFSLLCVQLRFPEMVRPKIMPLFTCPWKKSLCNVLMEVDDDSAMIVGDPQWILGQMLRPHLIHLSNIIA